MVAKKRPVGHPRTVNKDLPAGFTRSGDPPRVRVSGSAAGKRDAYAYRQAMEKKLGRKLTTNEIVDHLDPNTKADLGPKTRVISRSENSRNDGNVRKGPGGKFAHKPGKKKK